MSGGFEVARAVADAVLLEGYVLYPYRASATKNRFRWTFGVLAPRAWSEAGGCEPWWMEAQCLVDPGSAPRLQARLRFLHQRRRRVEAMDPAVASFGAVESLEAGGRLVLPWDEGDVREIDVGRMLSAPGGAAEHASAFEVPGRSDVEILHGEAGEVVGRIVHDQREVRGRIRIAVEKAVADRPLLRLRVRVENETPWADVGAARDDATQGSLLAAHLLMSVEDATFVSLLDPPEWARAAAAACRNIRVYPVLVGEPDRRDLVLASPIILYDHPQIAPESNGDFFDATEIDELLTLRTATLTEDEKRQARATDARAAAIVERVETLPTELMSRLHGAARGLRHAEMVPREEPSARREVAGVAPGAHVRLRAPGARRTDAQDLLYAGRTATVEKIVHDVEGHPLLAVTIDGDPAAELHRWYGRYHYYRLDEVDVVGVEGAR